MADLVNRRCPLAQLLRYVTITLVLSLTALGQIQRFRHTHGVSVTVSPTTSSLQAGQQTQFTATVSGTSNVAVTWTASGGTVTSSGLYTAPTAAGIYSVTATSQADSTRSASATVTVTTSTVIAVSISPTSASVVAGGTQQFTAFVTGSSDTAVTWSSTGGTVSNSGFYTAPAAAGTYSVTATSQADTTKSASATTTVTTASPSLAFIQAAAATPQSPVSTLTVIYPVEQTAGNLNVVVVGWNDSTSAVNSVSDSLGNTYLLAVGPATGTALSQSIYYAKNIESGNNAVTVNFNRPAVNPDIRILEYAGVDTVSPLDVTAAAVGNSSSASSGSATTTLSNELIFGADMVFTSTTSAGNGFASRVITSPDGDIAEDKVVSTTGSNSATATLGSAGPWVMQMAAFKAAGSTVIPPAVTVSVSPSSAVLTTGATQQFAASVTGSANTAVTWSASCGTVTASGLYTAPTTAGSCTVTAISQANTTKSSASSVTVTSSSTGVPTLVQHVSSSNTRNNDLSSPYCYHYQLPNFTTAGNSLIVGVTFNGNPIPKVSDDRGNSYAIQMNYYDNTDAQSIVIATAFNIVAGARVISVCFSSDPGGYIQPMASEFNNVVGIDASTASQGSGTSVVAGSMTPTVVGDLAYQVVFNIPVKQTSFTPGSQSNISWSLLSADLMDGWAAQYGLYNSTSAITPALTMGTSQKWVSAAVLLKTGTSGGVPSGMRIIHLLHENIPVNTSAGGTGNPFANPTSLQFPSSGNLLVAMIGGGLACTVTSISDTNQNTWTQAGAAEIQQAGNDTVGAYYAGNSISGNLGLTVHWSATNGDQTIFLYDVTGAASSPLDTTAGSSGSQSVAGNLTMPFTITPAGANEIIFEQVIWDYNTGSGLLGAGQFFDTNTFDGESQSGPEPVDQNNGWGHAITTSNAPVGITWETMYGGLPTGNWAGMAAAFKAAP